MGEKQIFPLAITTNITDLNLSTVSVEGKEYGFIIQSKDKEKAEAEERTIGIAPYFETKTIVMPECEKGHRLFSLIRNIDSNRRHIQLMHRLMSIGGDSRHEQQSIRRMQGQINEQQAEKEELEALNLSFAKQAITTFKSSEGDITFPVDADQARSIVALAQQGRIVRVLSNGSDDMQVHVTAEHPNLRFGKRKLRPLSGRHFS